MTGGLEQTSHPWSRIAQDWERYFTVPSRPSAEEVAQYRRWVGRSDIPRRALVLGATPELRDVLFECGLEVHVIDMSLEMVLAMTELLANDNADETLVKSDWLKNPLAAAHYDVVLADGVAPNVPWLDRNTLFDEVSRVLTDGGRFLNRTFFASRTKRYPSVDDVLVTYAGAPVSYQTATEIVFDLHLLTHDASDHLGSMQKVRDVLEPLRRNGRFELSDDLNKILDIIWNDWLQSAADKVWVYAFEDEEEAEYRERFTIAERFVASDHRHAGSTPMYLLEKLS